MELLSTDVLLRDRSTRCAIRVNYASRVACSQRCFDGCFSS